MNSTSPIVSTFATVAVPNTAVAPAVEVPDNCYEIIITNPNNAATAVVSTGVVGSTLNVPPTAPVGTVVLPESSVSLKIGTRSERGIIDSSQLAGSGLIVSATGAISVGITYLCRLGKPV